MKNFFLFFILLTALFFTQSCEEEPLLEEENIDMVAPEIPPAQMFSAPVDELTAKDVDTDSQTGGGGGGFAYSNWLHSAVSLVAWNTVVYINMAIPTAAFASAFNVEPDYIGDLTFLWVYQYEGPAELGGHTYDIALTGQYINEVQEVEWTMTVSQVNGFSDFVWYTGVTSTNNSEGYFILNRNPANPEPYLQMDYQEDILTEEASLRFTIVIPNDNANGHYLEYRTEPNEEFNRAFDVQGPPNDFMEIRWNEPAGNGQVRHPRHFNDNQWHCWSTEQLNIDC